MASEMSLQSFQPIAPGLTDQHEKVLEVIQESQPITAESVARKLGMSYHEVEDLVVELQENQEVSVAGRIENRYGNMIKQYEVAE